MAEYSRDIYLARKKYISMLEIYAKRHAHTLSGGREELTLSHKCDIPCEVSDKNEVLEAYKSVYSENVDREMAAGTSLYGPQRDDLVIKINGTLAKSFASQGQQRSCVLSLKLAEGEVIKEIFGEYPVFLFDDVLSELDEERRMYVAGKIEGMQTVITSCEGTERLGGDVRVISVKGGKYVSSYR